MKNSPKEPANEKRHPVNLKFTPEDYALLTQYAQEDNRSRANLAYSIILKYLHQRRSSGKPS